MLLAELKILGGKHRNKAVLISSKKFIIGREQDCHLRPSSDAISRHHCVFSVDDFAVRLRDLGSTNGTRVNGETLRGEVILKSGDVIGVGTMEFELIIRIGVLPSMTRTPNADTTAVLDELNSLPKLSTSQLSILSGMDTLDTVNAASIGQHVVSSSSDTRLGNDTVVVTAPDPSYRPSQAPVYSGMMPQGYPPAMPQGYPPAMPQGYPVMPGYGQPQMSFPQPYPIDYGQPYYPNMGGYSMPAPYPVAQASPLTETPAVADSSMGLKLPSPETTGFKEALAPPAETAPNPDAATASTTTTEKPSTSAADIIKNYMQKRAR